MGRNQGMRQMKLMPGRPGADTLSGDQRCGRAQRARRHRSSVGAEATMGDPNGPWQHDGDGDRPGDGTPRHLPSTDRAPAPPYDLGYGHHAVHTAETPPAGVPPVGPPPTGVPPAGAPPVGAPPAGAPYVSPPPSDGPYVGSPPIAAPYVGAEHDGAGYDDEPYAGVGPYGGTYGGGDHRAPRAGGAVASLRAAAGDVSWRYRSAPLWARVSLDLAAASLVLVLIVGVSLALRQDGGRQQAAADGAPRTPSTTTTSTTVPTTTTTTVAPTTTAPTTTTVPPTTTTTTAPPVVPPPTEPPPPPVTEPPTTTTEPVHYRDCGEALFAGALPLFEGEPGYGPHLDRDRDGEACEWNDDRRD
jgi:hypothetical protein